MKLLSLEAAKSNVVWAVRGETQLERELAGGTLNHQLEALHGLIAELRADIAERDLAMNETIDSFAAHLSRMKALTE